MQSMAPGFNIPLKDRGQLLALKILRFASKEKSLVSLDRDFEDKKERLREAKMQLPQTVLLLLKPRKHPPQPALPEISKCL